MHLIQVLFLVIYPAKIFPMSKEISIHTNDTIFSDKVDFFYTSLLALPNTMDQPI